MQKHIGLNAGKNIENVPGYHVVSFELMACVESILKDLHDADSKKWLTCINPHSYVVALDENEFSDALHGADWLIPDGSGIVLASYLLGENIRQRITGSDIFAALSSKANELGGRSYFFLGSSEETLAAIKDKMAVEYPNIRFAGSYSPPYKTEFSAEDSRKMVAVVNAARPDVLWVGMTAPKQEKWIHQYRNQLDVKFIGAVGAVFDFYAGNVKQARSCSRPARPA